MASVMRPAQHAVAMQLLDDGILDAQFLQQCMAMLAQAGGGRLRGRLAA